VNVLHALERSVASDPSVAATDPNQGLPDFHELRLVEGEGIAVAGHR
jgi:hypothetical protein